MPVDRSIQFLSGSSLYGRLISFEWSRFFSVCLLWPAFCFNARCFFRRFLPVRWFGSLSTCGSVGKKCGRLCRRLLSPADSPCFNCIFRVFVDMTVIGIGIAGIVAVAIWFLLVFLLWLLYCCCLAWLKSISAGRCTSPKWTFLNEYLTVHLYLVMKL